MKRSAILIAMLVNLTFAATPEAQADRLLDEPTKCEEYKSLYYQYLKNDMNEDARTFWLLAYQHCDDNVGKDSIFFNNGTIIYGRLLDAVALEDFATRAALIDSISWLYDEYYKAVNHPLIQLKHANFLKEREVHLDRQKELWKAIHALKADTPPIYLMRYYQFFLKNELKTAPKDTQNDKHKEGIGIMLQLADYANQSIGMNEENTKQKKAYQKAKDYLFRSGAQIVNDCEFLAQEIEQIMLDTLKWKNQEYVNDYVKLLEATNCTDAPIFSKLQEQLLIFDPSAAINVSLARSMYKKKDYARALTLYEEVIKFNVSDSLLNQITYEKALTYFAIHQYKKAFQEAKQVSGAQEGAALLLCAKAIASTTSSCGTSTFERESNYWLANDYVKKAVVKGANASSDLYLNQAPQKEDVFKNQKQMGDSVTLSCWGESTKIR